MAAAISWATKLALRVGPIVPQTWRNVELHRSKARPLVSVGRGSLKAPQARRRNASLKQIQALALELAEAELTDPGLGEELAAITGTISNPIEVPIASPSVCVGIDPDLSGAIAVLRTENEGICADVIDVPCVTVVVNKRTRRRHDHEAIADLVRRLGAPAGSVAFVEQAMPFPKDGKQGWYISGYGYGCWLGALASAGFKVVPVQARMWKSAMGLCGKEFSKDDSRAMASSLFPGLSEKLRRKKDHGRAEALLLAAFGKGLVTGTPG